ncbi:PilZ domain-containing protein [Marinobacter sp. SS21]|uniref:PilZ domain-containing protein n=1 Tax=Marinobacter sp. SS21 TaxID=2979460 RepID=UPI00233063A3|nr:PilZ domain-containing protein [Marinobacter sp. SS21]MDC0663777.1 PilZ domain-containing protein [Marinobacter sp. SS21]
MLPVVADRRIKTRYSARCLSVNVREQAFFGTRRKPTTVCCLDMNRYGMALLSPRPLDPGARLLLDFDGKYISHSGVAARAVNCRPFQTGFRVGIRFSYCSDKRSYCRTVDNALSRIEGLYSRRKR